MSDFLIDEDTDLLAGEFVLGTLDSEERANAQSLLRVDHGFIAMVRIWERRFGELHLMVEPVEPDAKIFQRIKAKIAEVSPGEPIPDGKPPPTEAMPSSEPAAATGSAASPEMPKPSDIATDGETPKPREIPANGAMPEPAGAPPIPDLETAAATASAPDSGIAEAADPAKSEIETAKSAAPVQPPLAPALEPTDELPEKLQQDRPAEITVAVIRSRARWRAFGVGLTVLVMGLVAMLAAWRLVPDRLPAGLRPAELMMSIGIDASPKGLQVKPAPPESQFEE
jgi:hypothetical protein